MPSFHPLPRTTRHSRGRRKLWKLNRFGTAALVLAVGAGIGSCAAETRRGNDTLVVGFIDDGSSAAMRAHAGSVMGAEEAASAARLLGSNIDIRVMHASEAGAQVRALREFAAEGAIAVIGGFHDAACDSLARGAQAAGVLFINVGCRADMLRSQQTRTTFHVEGSDSLYWAAYAADRSSGGRAPVLWHHALQRYGAAQLNQRFLRRYGEAPDASAWAGWMAVKVVWQATRAVDRGAYRTPAEHIAALAAHLESDSAIFDGHKGEALSFHASSHQLQQPLYAPPTSGAGFRITSVNARVVSADDVTALQAAWRAQVPIAVVSNEDSYDLTVIDLRRREVIATIPVHHRPRGVQLSSDGRWAYVAISDDSPTSSSDADAILVVDLQNGALVSRHAAGSDPEQFAITPDGRMLVASNEDAGTATITELSTGRPLATVAVGIEPEGVAASPDGKWVYVTAETSNTVSVIDMTLRDVVASFMVDERPRAVTFSPDSRRAWVTNEISGTVSVVELPQHRVIGTVRLGDARAKPVGVAVSPDSRMVYVANGHAGTVSVIDAQTLREVRTIAVGRRPWGVAVNGNGSLLVTANGTSNDVSIVELASQKVIATIRSGERPWGVAIAR